MLGYIILVVIAFIASYYFFYHVQNMSKLKLAIQDNGNLLLKDAILFSNEELARCIKKSFNENIKSIKMIYFNDEYVHFNDDDTKEQILQKIERIQNLLIEERYKNSTNSVIQDIINKKILDVWLDFGYKNEYRRIFCREIESMLENKEISNSTFNLMYTRFYNIN